MSNELPFTGERFVPHDPAAKGEMWYEHWHRYHFVAPMARARRVLDVACGEGYGSALLADAAAAVTGVDISPAAITHARNAYAAKTNLKFVEASCDKLPFDDGVFDLVVSFETLEHIDAQDEFFAEVRRVLDRNGVFMVSTPDKAEYSDKRGYKNEFHVKELYGGEFERLIARHFTRCRLLFQRNAFVSMIHEGESGLAGELTTVSQTQATTKLASLPPLYRIALATNGDGTGWDLPARLSVFCDAEEWAFEDYRASYRGMVHYAKREKALEAEVAALKQQLQERDSAPVAPATATAATSPTAESSLARFIKKLSA
jgi:SAM-dependent methyltransferase